MSSQCNFTDASSNHDFILDASDGVRIYVLKAFLSYSSDFFKHLFMDSTPERNCSSAIPILNIAERGSTMLALLPFCYPGTPPPPSSFDGLLDVLFTIRKYLMQDIEAQFETALLASQLMSDEPLRMYAVAVHCKSEGLARGAAKKSLLLPLRDVLSFVKELALIPASAYHHLLAYHAACSKVTIDALDPPTFLRVIRGGRPGDLSTCPICEERLVRQTIALSNGLSGDAYGHQWLFTYAKELREQVQRSPGRVRLADSENMDKIMRAATSCCGQGYSVASKRIETVAGILERLVDQVSLTVDDW